MVRSGEQPSLEESMMHPDADNASPAAAASSMGARNDLRVPPFAFI